MAVRVVPVVDAPWDDVRAVFGTRGDPSTCWCQFFKVDNSTWNTAGPAAFERALCDQIDAARTAHGAGPGVLAYEGEEPVGWVAIEERSAYRRILKSREPDDAEGVWIVSCFVVRVGHRRKGVARALLAGAEDHARAHGARVLEAFPTVERPKISSADLYHGPLSLFEAEGWEIVDRPTPNRAVVRLQL